MHSTRQQIRKLFALAAFWLLTAQSMALLASDAVRNEVMNNPCNAGGVYLAYPGPADTLAVTPEGYEPFYISHYGRHGSRYLISDDDYLRVAAPLQQAAADSLLTPLGYDLLRRLGPVMEEAAGRGGELTPLGTRQHKGIARRMFLTYPEIFTNDAVITARSTQVMRCAHSMMAFCESLKEMNPRLRIPKESSSRWMSHLCWWTPEASYFDDHGPGKPAYNAFEKENVKSERFLASILKNPADLSRLKDHQGKAVTADALMWGVFWIAVDLQNMETGHGPDAIAMFDIFTPEELYRLWRVTNFSFYYRHADYPPVKGIGIANARNLLENIIDTADEYIAGNKGGATLRFGHDGNITPLSALMQFSGFDGQEADPEKVEDVWASFRITPMASNLQMILFRPAGADNAKPEDILVKFMMNEHDVLLPIKSDNAPFYRWSDARTFLKSRVEAADKSIADTRKALEGVSYK